MRIKPTEQLTRFARGRSLVMKDRMFWQLIKLLVSTVIAIVIAAWSVRSYISDHESSMMNRFSELEQKMTDKLTIMDQTSIARMAESEKQALVARQKLDELQIKVEKELVPRSECESHWAEERSWHEDIKSDIRDLRVDIKDAVANMKTPSR
jgi:hypothetical protein